MSGFFDEMMSEAQQTGTGAGRYICQAQLQIGYRIFKRGVSLGDSFFPANPLNRENLLKSLQKAREEDPGERVPPWGGDPQPNVDERNNRVFRFTLFKETILNKDMTDRWPSGDRHHDLVFWHDSVTEVLVPSLKEAGFNFETDLNQRFWVDLTMVPDPYQQSQGVEGDDLDFVPRVNAIFSSREEALEAAGGDALVGTDEEWRNIEAPGGDWNNMGTSWEEWRNTIVEMLNEELPENSTPKQTNDAVSVVYGGLDKAVPKEKIREIANTLVIPF